MKMDFETGLQCMADLETMSCESNASIVAIGAVMFHPDGTGIVGEKFYVKVRMGTHGLHVSADTVEWWLQQSEAARMELLKDPLPLYEALAQFTEWYESRGGVPVWGNGSDFDNVILRNAYRAAAMDCPFDHHANRCFRTFKTMFGRDVELPPSVGTSHCAVDDAEWQVLYLQKIVREKFL